MKSFDSGMDMLKTLWKGEDLYNIETGDYVFHYSEKGSIAVYNLSLEEASELADKCRDEYWGSELGPGGLIYDDPDEYEDISEGNSNQDYCNKHYKENGWMSCKEFALSIEKEERDR